MNRQFSLIGLSFVVLVYSCSISAFVLVQQERVISSSASVTETVWEDKVSPSHIPDERIGLHRYRSNSVTGSASLLYLPGTNMNGQLAVLEEDYNLWLYLANRGVTVYALDYRNHFLGSDDLEDVSFMKNWTLESYVKDAARAAEFIKALTLISSQNKSPQPLFASGFSRGASIAYGLTSASIDLAGLIILDGSFKNYRFEHYARKEAMKKLEDSGNYAFILSKARGWGNRQKMMREVYSNPQGLAADQQYKTIGEQLSATLYTSWGPGTLANPRDGISSIVVLARMMEAYDRYYPAIQNIEGSSIASQVDDPATAIDDNWGELTMPILYFGAANMGTDHLLNGIYSAGKSGSKDVTIHLLENHGHLDVLVSNQAKDEVYEVARQWIVDKTH